MTPVTPDRRAAVSIILPTYNRAKFLPQAFASIRSQAFTDWELIVVDDGSTDDTAALVAELTAGWPQKVTYHTQENQGAYGARNTGLDLATGEYVAFFDSDDVWLPHHLADCVAAMAANPDVDWAWGACRVVDFATGDTITPSTFYVDGTPRPFLTLAAQAAGRLKVITDPNRLVGCISHGFYCGLQNSVIRASVFANRRFDAAARNEGEDLLLTVRALNAGHGFGYFDNVHVLYSVHDSNSSVPVGGKAPVDKRVKTMLLSLQGFEALAPELPPAARRATDRMVAHHYFWTVGYTLWQHDRRDEARAMFRKALRKCPGTIAYWKTYLGVLIRSALTPRPRRQNGNLL